MKKEKIAVIALIIASIITIPELPAIIDYVKGFKELGEMILALLVRAALWAIVIKIVLFVYGIVAKAIKKVR